MNGAKEINAKNLEKFHNLPWKLEFSRVKHAFLQKSKNDRKAGLQRIMGLYFNYNQEKDGKQPKNQKFKTLNKKRKSHPCLQCR